MNYSTNFFDQKVLRSLKTGVVIMFLGITFLEGWFIVTFSLLVTRILTGRWGEE